MFSNRHERSALRATAMAVAAGVLAAGCEPSTGGGGDAPDNRTEQQGVIPEPQTGAAEPPAELDAVAARAVIEPTRGNEANGTVTFQRAPDGAIAVVAAIRGLEPGPHGFHIHETGDCSAPDASSAGDHFSPDDDPHGSPGDDPGGHHAGDLGNLNADDAGVAEARVEDDELEIEGEYGVVGRAVIVHAERDDLHSQPGGGAGDPVACGVVRRVDDEPASVG